MRKRNEIILGDKRRRGRYRSKTRSKVSTLVGLVVAAVVVLLAMQSMEKKTRIRQAQVDVSKISHAARLFRADFGRCPVSIEELNKPPSGVPYLQFVEDPWGQPYMLRCPAFLDPGNVNVASGGPNGDMSGRDNINSF